ncbi:hypothetical protein ACS0TY_005629 [Phlomoides rotata]
MHHGLEPDTKWLRNHPPELVIGNVTDRVKTRRQQHEVMFASFLSETEPKNIEEALSDVNWILAMQEELNIFERNQVWELVP